MFRYNRPWNVHKFLFFYQFYIFITFLSHFHTFVPKYLYNLVFAKYHISITKLWHVTFLYHCHKNVMVMWLDQKNIFCQVTQLSNCHKNVIVMWLDLKIFFWSSHVTITFLWQLYENVMRHNFLMEMWLLANIGYDSQY